jgi:hypothetical protein
MQWKGSSVVNSLTWYQARLYMVLLVVPPPHGSSPRRPRHPLRRVFVRRSTWRRPLRGSSPCRPHRPYVAFLHAGHATPYDASLHGVPPSVAHYVAPPYTGHAASYGPATYNDADAGVKVAALRSLRPQECPVGPSHEGSSSIFYLYFFKIWTM